MKNNTTYTLNKEHNGVEIYFNNKPIAEIRDTLKAHGFRWHRQKGCWYSKQTAERLALAEQLACGQKTEAEPKATKPAVTPAHSLRVGDILAASWGYEQTNVDLYQVVALKGRTMVSVRRCALEVDHSEAVSGMSEDVSYKLPQDGGAVRFLDEEIITRKVKNYYQDKRPEGDQVDIKDFITASKYTGQTLYRSWYH